MLRQADRGGALELVVKQIVVSITAIEARPMPTYKQIFMVFLKMGAFAFGGVYAMLAFFQRELVDKRKWLKQDEFAEGMAIGQMTPGPPIINTGIYVGYHLKGPKGALAATAGQVLPGFVLVLGLAYVYKEFEDVPLFSMVLKGVGAAVVGLLVSVVYKMGRQLVRGRAAAFFAIGGFILLHFLKANPIALIALAGATGYLLYGRSK
ncbi:MAG: chromate transporter [Deltaproteobacteria bacterium CG_4_10_14_3_um_filter_60_8]|nr:MAG: chromate transporter [Deltaproteobacteria bacterium CG23_combo_of_CG06-09_8_20_14_all_60_8]PIY23006.1 MAG: chromate transporter [Deltaproteobacteria bacterium CG_4_10_14_3_um_filter_60_8]